MQPGPWEQAQIEERRFHCDETAHVHSVKSRESFEDIQRQFFAGVMSAGLPHPLPHPKPSVTDIGCGPKSLLLLPWIRSQVGDCIAVDPLTFLPEQEERYREANVKRIVCPAEEYDGRLTDEVWMYNCLQHVKSPTLVMNTVSRHAAKIVRLIEWIDVPTDTLHLHTITSHQIWDKFTKDHGFFAWRTYEGLMGEPGRQTRFYGCVFIRPPYFL